MDGFETVADIEAELRALARAFKGMKLPPLAVVFSSLASHLHSTWEREKAEIEANALSAGGIVEASRHKQAVLEFCDVYCMVYPPGDPDVPAALQGAFLNLCDALGIEQVKIGESGAANG